MLTEREKVLLGILSERYRHSQAGRLVKGIVHNVNNLLHTMSMQVELLKRRLTALEAAGGKEPFETGKAKCQEKVEQITGELARLADLISNIITKGIHDDARDAGPVDLNALLGEELAMLHANPFFKHKVEKRVELTPRLPSAYGYHVDFSQAVSALIDNGLEAMEGSEKRVLTVTTGQRNGSVVMSVTDTGCGISEENGERIYEPFYTTKGLEAGHAGLGLYIARTLVSSHGGSITHTCGPEGATFEIAIPTR